MQVIKFDNHTNRLHTWLTLGALVLSGSLFFMSAYLQFFIYSLEEKMMSAGSIYSLFKSDDLVYVRKVDHLDYKYKKSADIEDNDIMYISDKVKININSKNDQKFSPETIVQSTDDLQFFEFEDRFESKTQTKAEQEVKTQPQEQSQPQPQVQPQRQVSQPPAELQSQVKKTAYLIGENLKIIVGDFGICRTDCTAKVYCRPEAFKKSEFDYKESEKIFVILELVSKIKTTCTVMVKNKDDIITKDILTTPDQNDIAGLLEKGWNLEFNN